MDGDPTSKDAASDNTEEKQSGLKPWAKGTSGNPKGRPKGSRNKLGDEFCDALYADFQENGVETIRLIRQRDPIAWGKLIKDILPRQAVINAFSLNVDAEISEFGDAATIDEILEVVARESGIEAAQVMASMFGIEMPESISPMIELNPEAETAWRTDPNNDEWRPPKRGRSPRPGE